MNEAAARGMSFGPEIMFTYGPYAPVGTRVYHPATDRRMMLGSAALGFSYAVAMVLLAGKAARLAAVFLLIFLATFGSPELLLLSYAFLLAVSVLKRTNEVDRGEDRRPNWMRRLTPFVLWPTLGLLPVVKGSLLLPFAVSMAVPAIFLLHRGRPVRAIAVVLIPTLSACALWVCAGQRLADLATFLSGTISLTSGYTEAMSTAWSILPAAVGDGFVVLYLAVSAGIMMSIHRAPRLAISLSMMLAILSSFFLLVIFKHGFVGVSNVSGVFASLAVLILILCLVYVDRLLIWSICGLTLLTAATSIIRDPQLLKDVHDRFGTGAAWEAQGKRRDILEFCARRAMAAYPRMTYINTWHTYEQAWVGLGARFSFNNDLETRYGQALQSIRTNNPVPLLKGTVDFYEYDQSMLLASNNQWDPRPVIQSYSAYTPELALRDEAHLRGNAAPDWLLFKLQSIDGRLPSLDDGASWPAFFDQYRLTAFDGRMAVLSKRESIVPASTYVRVMETVCKTGDTIAIPASDGLLFAQIDLRPTLAGKLLIALYRPPQLRMTLTLEDGEKRSFRVVSSMMRTKFLLSPLVDSTAEFAALMGGEQRANRERTVRTISIQTVDGSSTDWSATYELTLDRYVGR